MKRINLILLFVALICSVAMLLYVHNQRVMSSDLFMFKIEALARTESPSPCTARKVCDPYGSFIECSGRRCSIGFRSVTCDGVKYSC